MEEIGSLDFGRRIKLVGNLQDIENF